jgi:hypothetical protein
MYTIGIMTATDTYVRAHSHMPGLAKTAAVSEIAAIANTGGLPTIEIA